MICALFDDSRAGIVNVAVTSPLVGPVRGEVARFAGSSVLFGAGPRCREDTDSPDAVRACVDCGRRGDEARAGRADGVRRGRCLKVEDLRGEDSDDTTGLGLGAGDA